MIVPTVELPPLTPLTRQVTALLAVPLTVAANVCVADVDTVANDGVTATVMGGGVAEIVTDAVANWVGSAADTALTVTVAGDGTLAGAVYKPAVLIVPTVELPATMPLTRQVTAVLAALLTVAANIWVPFTARLALDGATTTDTAAGGTVIDAG